MTRATANGARGLGWPAVRCAVVCLVASLGLAGTAAAQVVINEIDYDQVGVDTAEFIELKNNGATSVNLSTFTLRLINAGSSTDYSPSPISLPDVDLAAGDYFVISADATTVANTDFVVAGFTVENGSPDAVQLLDGAAIEDTVSYEGTTAGFSEGTGTPFADDNVTPNIGLSRSPDGVDTDMNSADVLRRCITPGAPNSLATGSCPAPLIVRATKTDSLESVLGVSGDADADGEADPGDTVSYTVEIEAIGADAPDVTFDDTVDTNSTVVLSSVRVTPIAFDDSYPVACNAAITVPVGSGVLANDIDPDAVPPLSNTGVTAVLLDTGATTGSVVLAANGSFTYTPTPGFTGTDTFAYTARDATALDSVETGVVSLAVGTDCVWFIDNSLGAAGNGTLATPFNTLAAFEAVNGNGGANDPAAGDCVFLFTGSGDYTGGVTLENNQILMGQGAGNTVANVCGLTVPGFSNAFPATTGTPAGRPDIVDAGGDAITLASANTIRGLDIGNTPAANTRLAGTGVGALTVTEVAIAGTGRAVDITTGGPGLAVTFDSIGSTSSSGAPGIDLTGIVGSFTVSNGAGTDTSISGAASGISIQSSAATYSFGDTSVSASSSGIDLGKTFPNPASTFTFDSLSATVTAGHGFRANNSGTVNISGSANTIDATSGTGFEMTDTLIGTGITFQSIDVDASGGANVGIILDDTGTGTFSVNGTGTTDGSGGTIENMLADGATLNNTDGLVTFNNMIFEDIGTFTVAGLDHRSQQDAIHGQTVDGGLTLNNTTIRRISDQGINGALFAGGVGETSWNGLSIIDSVIEDTNRWTNACASAASPCVDDLDEAAVRVFGITGTVVVSGSTFRRAAEGLALFTDDVSGTTTVTVTDSEFRDINKLFTYSPGAQGKACFNFVARGAMDADVTIGDKTNTALANTFHDCAQASVVVSQDTATSAAGHVDLIIGQNTFEVDNHTSLFTGTACGVGGFNFPQGGLAIKPGGSSSATMDALIVDNVLDELMHADGGLGQLTIVTDNSSTSRIKVEDNFFQKAFDQPWRIIADGNSNATILFDGNTHTSAGVVVPECGAAPVHTPFEVNTLNVRNGSDVDAVFKGEKMVRHDISFGADEQFKAEVQSSGGTLCLDLDGNAVANAAPDGYNLRRNGGTFDLEQSSSNSGPCSGCGAALLADVLLDNGNTGTGGAAGGTPPFLDTSGTINIVTTACTEPSGGIFAP